jgi:hypothetical protein
MSKNIEIEYKDGRPLWYVTKSTPELRMPSLAFRKEEEAELAVAIAKVLKSRGIDAITNSELTRDIQYTFRVLGLVESEWFGMPNRDQ